MFHPLRTTTWVASFFAGSLLVFLASCSEPVPPAEPFEAYSTPVPPDYSDENMWASLPTKADPADYVPPGVTPENQANAAVDVFFIHPTILFTSEYWNAEITDTALNRQVDESTIRHQASVFNHDARVFAPRYRQMAYEGFFTADFESEVKALDLAYSDVKNAFDYYLEHHNDGRPIIIASHSQGTVHGIRLVREYFDGTDMQSQLVAAYLVGWPFPEDTFKTIPVCATPDQNNCVMGWCTWREGQLGDNHDTYYKGSVVVNPISWQYDEALAPKSMHQGFLNKDFSTIKSQHLHAQAHDGVLWVNRPIPLLPPKNYHIADYNLFWVDIRENVATRVLSYLESHPVQASR